MDHDYLWDVPLFEHKAIAMPRKGFLAENVFYDNWVQMLTQDRDMSEPDNQRFADVLGSYGHEINERVATVAATFISWLGTNVGFSYRDEARRLSKVVPYKHDAYLMAWAVHNLRHSSVSAGRRQLEACLSNPALDKHDHINRAPVLSSQDYEVVEHLVVWLGTDDGQDFLEKCENILRRKQHETDFRTYLTSNLKLGPGQVDKVLAMAEAYKPDTKS